MNICIATVDLVLGNCNKRAQSVAARAPNIDLYGTNGIFGHIITCLEVTKTNPIASLLFAQDLQEFPIFPSPASPPTFLAKRAMHTGLSLCRGIRHLFRSHHGQYLIVREAGSLVVAIVSFINGIFTMTR